MAAHELDCTATASILDLSGTYLDLAGAQRTLRQDGSAGECVGRWPYTISGSTLSIDKLGMTGIVKGSPGSYVLEWSNGDVFKQQAASEEAGCMSANVEVLLENRTTTFSAEDMETIDSFTGHRSQMSDQMSSDQLPRQVRIGSSQFIPMKSDLTARSHESIPDQLSQSAAWWHESESEAEEPSRQPSGNGSPSILWLQEPGQQSDGQQEPSRQPSGNWTPSTFSLSGQPSDGQQGDGEQRPGNSREVGQPGSSSRRSIRELSRKFAWQEEEESFFERHFGSIIGFICCRSEGRPLQDS